MKKIKQYKPRRSIGGKQYSPKKKSAREKGYDRDWDKFRFRFLHHNPKCYVCGERSTICDHIVAHKGDKEKFEAINNFMPLCTRCHNYITGKFDKYEVPRTEEKLKWVEKTRKEYGTTVNIKVIPYKKD